MSRPAFRHVGGVGVDGMYCLEVRHAALKWTMEHPNAKTGKSGDECFSTGKGHQGKSQPAEGVRKCGMGLYDGVKR